MAGEIVAVLNVFKPVKDFVFDSVKDYVGYIGSCDENLGSLHVILDDLCNKKELIEEKVMRGTDRQEKITREAASWLQDVRVLADDEMLKGLIYKDIHTAKLILKMMAKKDLKRRLSKDTEMQQVVVKVMKELKEEMVMSEGEMRIFKEADYKKVTEVVVEMMKDTVEEFKKLMKEDRMMAVIATRTLKGRDLDKLMEGDMEMEDIFREARNGSEEELLPKDEDVEYNAPLLKIPPVDSDKNRLKKAAKKVFTPLTNLFTPLQNLMNDASFKKAVPEAGVIKLGLEVIDGLFIKGHGMNKEMDSDAKKHRCCCCSSLSLCDYHGRYQISKAAEFMSKHIRDEIIDKRPQNSVTIPTPTRDLKGVPTQFLESLESRKKLVHQILEKLNDDQVDVVGVFGMGGAGKTTIAKEVNKRLKDFDIKVMVEVSDAPDIARSQATIAESIDLPLHGVDDVRLRAIKLHNILSNKEKKILIVLDNVWKELNLGDIGIPSTCKLLLTTREREVCRVMNVEKGNILEVDLMNIIESKALFTKQIGVQVDAGKYKNVVERLLNKCGGLPLTIVATANSLRDKDFSSWEKFADDSEKPTSSQISGEYRHIYAILSTSYKFIEVEEKRIFFLLACLTPRGSGVSIENLMRYGVGLNLFKHVNKLSEAMEQADTWANELVLSSMLVEGDVKGEVKIHDIVRAFAISLASKEEGHKFMVEDIPRWMDDGTLRKYTAMSLTSMDKCSCFGRVEAIKLQILILKGDIFSNFNDSFFEGMTNLEVLVLSNVKFQPSLPESMGKLKKLRTLCMEGCKLGDIKQVGVLVNLLVLSLRNSSFEELPNEIGELSKLLLLDLSECTCSKKPLIPSTVLARLSKLEGLYTFINQEGVSVFEKTTDEEMGIGENRLPYLNVFEVRVPETEDLVIDEQSLLNLDKFIVSVGKSVYYHNSVHSFSRILCIGNIDDRSKCFENSSLKALLKKVDCLTIMSYSNNFENIVPELDPNGFRDLEFLKIFNCDNITCIVNGRMTHISTTFSCLRSLYLSYSPHLKRIYDGEAPEGLFCNLQNLHLEGLNELEYGLPLVPCNLKEIFVTRCRLLNFIFTEDEAAKVIELPFLKSLVFHRMPCLSSLVGPKEPSTTIHAFSEDFFDAKITYPSLEVFKLFDCGNIIKLWNKEIPTSSFGNLKEVEILHCHNLLNVGPPFAFSIFGHLEDLHIAHCDKMSEIITPEDTGELKVIRFPELKFLSIESVHGLESFYKGKSRLEFPKLEKLWLNSVAPMKSFATSENSLALFHENIDFPCLDTLEVTDMPEVNALWDSRADRGIVMFNPDPLLRQLTVGTSGLRHIPYVVASFVFGDSLQQLQFLDISDCKNMGAVVINVVTSIELPRLKELSLMKLDSMKSFSSTTDGEATLRLPSLESLAISECPALEHFWSGSIIAPRLQSVELRNCNNMQQLLVGTTEHVMEFSSLQQVDISCCSNMHSFSGTPLVAPKVTHIEYNLKQYSVLPYDDLNHFLKEMLATQREEEDQQEQQEQEIYTKQEEVRKNRMSRVRFKEEEEEEEEGNKEEAEEAAAVEDI